MRASATRPMNDGPAGAERLDRRPSRPAPLTRGERQWLIAIVVGAAVLRLVWVAYAARTPRGLFDPSFYSVYARQIATGHGYSILHIDEPTAYYPVGYSAALAPFVWLVLHTPLPDNIPKTIGLFNLVCGVVTVALVFELARRLFDNRVGLVAAAIVAVWPNLVFHTAAALTETFFNLLVVAAVLVLVWEPWNERLPVRRLVAFAVLLALSALVRPISLLALPVLVIALLVAGFGWRRTLEHLGVVVLAVVVVIAPWTIRNLVVMKSPVLISTNLGDNLCIGRHPGATGAFDFATTPAAGGNPGGTAYCFHDLGSTKRPAYEIRRNNLTTKRALSYFRHHPFEEVPLSFWRTYYTVRNDHDGLDAVESYGANPYIPHRLRDVLALVADAWFFTASVLALLALPAILRGRDPQRLFLVLTAFALGINVVIFFGDPRFHVPLLPFIAIGTAVALLALRDGLRERVPR